jgi:hypothetical protein
LCHGTVIRSYEKSIKQNLKKKGRERDGQMSLSREKMAKRRTKLAKGV